MAAQIACGMSYLVRREVIHKDLAARSSIIDDNFKLRAKPIPLQVLFPMDCHCQENNKNTGSMDGF